jgi:5-methyltetrahydrofolate--homocysteine methyltransferase
VDVLQELADHIINGDDEKVPQLTEKAIKQNLPVKEILDNGLIAGMNIVGEKFKTHVIFLPDVLLSARAMTAGMEILKPLMIKEGIPTIGKVVIGSVKGDLHDIGKNLVSIMLRGAGFEVFDLGNDVPSEKFVETAEAKDATVIGMSALLTTTMSVMKDVVEKIKEKGLSPKIKTIIGGAPVSKDYALEIGADAYAFDGANAVDIVKSFF